MSDISIIDSYGDRVVIKREDLKSLERQLDLAKVNERDLNDIIQALNDELTETESQLAEVREEVETYKYDLETLISIVHDCLYNMSHEECYDTLKQVDEHYKQLREKGE